MGTIDEMLSAIIKDSFEAIKKANEIKRKPAPLSKLVVGLECGGSDGFSGISTNPALGRTSDLLVALKGTAILSEFPELCGEEQELVNRCVDEDKANKFLGLMNDFETGAIIRGEKSIEEMAEELLDLIIDVSSGNFKTKSMLLNQNDFIPCKRGVSL